MVNIGGRVTYNPLCGIPHNGLGGRVEETDRAKPPTPRLDLDLETVGRHATWTCFFLYVILDVFSRYIVGWTVRHRETAELAKALIEQATGQQPITPSILHADRGAPMRSKPSRAARRSRRRKTHSRPYTSSDNP